jgi:hypothetical protein
MLPAYQCGYRVFLGVNAAGVVLTPAAAPRSTVQLQNVIV